MGEVVQFPTDRDWHLIREAIQEILVQAGIEGDDRAAICDRIKPRFERLKGEFSWSTPIPAECLPAVEELQKALADFVHEISNKALMQIVELEAALYMAQNRTD